MPARPANVQDKARPVKAKARRLACYHCEQVRSCTLQYNAKTYISVWLCISCLNKR